MLASVAKSCWANIWSMHNGNVSTTTQYHNHHHHQQQRTIYITWWRWCESWSPIPFCLFHWYYIHIVCLLFLSVVLPLSIIFIYYIFLRFAKPEGQFVEFEHINFSGNVHYMSILHNSNDALQKLRNSHGKNAQNSKNIWLFHPNFWKTLHHNNRRKWMMMENENNKPNYVYVHDCCYLFSIHIPIISIM